MEVEMPAAGMAQRKDQPVPDHHLQAFTEHIHWLPPYAPTDRPALGLITGRRETLLVDAGASAAHARLLLDGAAAHHLRSPTLLHLTHWHWDHVFAGGSFAVPTFASRETRRIVTGLAALPWDDAALDARVAEGTEIPFCRDMIRAELPDPNRAPAIRPPTVGFSGEVDRDLGGLTVTLAHVGGDHAADSSIVYVPDDGVAFLGDCLGSSIYGGPRRYTATNLLPLFDRLLRYDAAWYVLGHAPEPLPRAELGAWAAHVHALVVALDRYGADRAAVVAAAGEALGAPLTADDLEDLDLLLQGLAG